MQSLMTSRGVHQLKLSMDQQVLVFDRAMKYIQASEGFLVFRPNAINGTTTIEDGNDHVFETLMTVLPEKLYAASSYDPDFGNVLTLYLPEEH